MPQGALRAQCSRNGMRNGLAVCGERSPVLVPGMWSSIQITRRGETGIGPSPKQQFDLVDELWNNLVFGCIGETVDPGDNITGVRWKPADPPGCCYGLLRARLAVHLPASATLPVCTVAADTGSG